MILSGFSKRRNTVTSFDTDAQAYFTRLVATGYTVNNTEKYAIHNFVTTLKANSLYTTKISEMWFLLGNMAESQSLSFKNTAYNITWAGGPDHRITGVKFNGVSNYGVTTYRPGPSGAATINDAHLGVYSRTSTSTSGMTTESLFGNRVANNSMFMIHSRGNNYSNGSSDSAAAYIMTSGGMIGMSGNTNGSSFYLGSRINSTDGRLFKNGVEIAASTTLNSPSTPNISMYIGACNNAGVANYFTDKEISFLISGKGLTTSEVAILSTAVDLLLARLSRKV
ncbi:hypothetical protein [Flaviaesturariibacter amylovorans]|uniref:Uncharacterized protein n=1 Tax=Flaviaesturariibacter amylovorans TaxID=1084520 RepID=A0ABP8GL02_9BACT